MSNLTKQEVLENLEFVINDCTDFENWDTSDEDNWNGMLELLSSVKEYIENN